METVMVTIQEVAQASGASKTAVSLVLNNKDAKRVNPQVAERIRRAAEELGYRPNSIARSLRTKRTRTLGFISDEIASTPFAGKLILGAQDAARDLGYVLLTINTNNDAQIEDEGIAALRRYGVDGFLYAFMYHRVVRVPQSLLALPTVVLDAEDVDGVIPGIMPDEPHLSYVATERLISAGRRRILYVGTTAPIPAREQRLSGYRQAMEDSPIGFDAELVVDISDDVDAFDVADEAIRRLRPDGIVCFNDIRATVVYDCMKTQGLVVGEDTDVIGIDNQPFIAQMLRPRLTSVELPHYEMGYWSVAKLVSIIEDRDPADLVLPEQLGEMPSLTQSHALAYGKVIDKQSVRV